MDPGHMKTFYDFNTNSVLPLPGQPPNRLPPPSLLHPHRPDNQPLPWSPPGPTLNYSAESGLVPTGDRAVHLEAAKVPASNSPPAVIQNGGKPAGAQSSPSPASTIGKTEEDDINGSQDVALPAFPCSPPAVPTRRNTDRKRLQETKTLVWLTDNYELVGGVCLPRCVVYDHYKVFCAKNGYAPAGAAAFGKILRMKFPNVPTRRLGTRGQSKYHYEGLGIKQTSEFYHSVYTGKGFTRYSGVKVRTEGSNRRNSINSKMGLVLPKFPDVENLKLPDAISPEQMDTVMRMYRLHCQRILDVVINTDFDEVGCFMLHFWQSFPDHLRNLLHLEIVHDLIILCDSILYKVLIDVMIPSSIQELPEKPTNDIQKFAKMLPRKIDMCMDQVPERLRERRVVASTNFKNSILQHLHFLSFAQKSRIILQDDVEVQKMLLEIQKIDLNDIFHQMPNMGPPIINKVQIAHLENHYPEYFNLMRRQAPLESFIEWIDTLIDISVFQECKENAKYMESMVEDFLLAWFRISVILETELTMLRCESYGKLHVIQSMLEQYIKLVIDTYVEQQDDRAIQQLVQRHMKNTEVINMQVTVRTAADKTPVSSVQKHRKRKVDESMESSDGSEQGEKQHRRPVKEDERVSDVTGPSSCQLSVKTAFTRPSAYSHRDSSFGQAEDAARFGQTHQAHHTSSGSSQSPVSGITLSERTPYFPQFGLNTAHSGYPTHNMALSSSRTQSYADLHGHGQTFPSVSFPVGNGGLPGTYPRGNGFSPAFYSDPYSQHGSHSVPSDSYKDATFFYSQEAARGLSTARGYFSARTDTYQGSSLAMGSAYGDNFMEIAPSATQLPWHNSLPHYQDYPPKIPYFPRDFPR